MRYILHYTRPGDLVLDGFCGTGMTGVAAQLCGDAKEIEALGYHINDDGTILDEQGLVISTIGERHPILSDLSPIATFIARNYLGLSDFACFQREALKVIDDVEESLSWLYDHPAGKVVSAIWSDVFLCPHCGEKIVFWESAPKNSSMKKSFPCPSCSSIVGKSPPKADRATKLVRASHTKFDHVLNQAVRVPQFVIVEQTIDGGSKRLKVKISDDDRKEFEQRLSNHQWPNIPTTDFFPGRQTNKLINGTGISHICHMYTPRALFAAGELWQLELSSSRHTEVDPVSWTELRRS